jgi:hypothetical protein
VLAGADLGGDSFSDSYRPFAFGMWLSDQWVVA